MKACIGILPALALASLLFAAGCGQSSVKISPSDTPSDADYESDFEADAGNEGQPAKKAPSGEAESEGESN